MFYAAMPPVVKHALAHRDDFVLGDLPAAETRLHHLVLASAGAALAVETDHAPQLPLTPIESRIKVTHTRMDG